MADLVFVAVTVVFFAVELGLRPRLRPPAGGPLA